MSDVRLIDQMEWLQEALYYGMLSCDLFNPLNIVLERTFVASQEIQLDAIWTTVRNGTSGAGCLIEMPKLSVERPNSQVNQIIGSVVIFEERNVNLTPGTGTGITAESWAQMAVEFMRGWIIGQAGGLVVEPNAIVKAEDWINADAGIIALRGSVSQRASRPNYTRCGTPVFAMDGSYNVTLTNVAANPTADILFTVDGSFPARPEALSTTTAQLYNGSFVAVPGQIIQYIALSPGLLPSHIGAQTIT